jgi:CP family cyanate transporter-like MFS transporter
VLGTGPRLAAYTGAAVIGIALMATTMRGPFTSVGPLLPIIRADTGLSTFGAGALGMLPLLAFAIVSPVAPALGRRIGLERGLGLALAGIAVGVLLRSVPGAPALFTGTALVGLSIGVVNVLLSGLVKRDQPGRAAALTGLYTTTMGAFAMLGSGIAVPVANAAPGGWRTSLGLWAVPAVVALLVWLPRLRRGAEPAEVDAVRASGHWRSPLAWQLTAFMGLQSLGFYVSVSWLPTILQGDGVSETSAGWHLALMQLTGLLASAASASVVRRLPDQRAYAAGAAVLGVVSFLGFVAVPNLGWLWSGTVGLSQGVGITLALSFYALRARDAGQAAALSGMGQSLGYLFAALGPLLFGLLHDATGGWGIPLIIVAGLILAQAVVALGAGRDRVV